MLGGGGGLFSAYCPCAENALFSSPTNQMKTHQVWSVCVHTEKTGSHWQLVSHPVFSRLREHKRGSLKTSPSLDPRSLARASPWRGPSNLGHKEDNLPFVSVGAWVKLNSHKLLLQLSPYLDVKCYSLISHPQHPHPFIPKGYQLRWWCWWWWWWWWWWRRQEWLGRICCRSSTLPSSSSKARFAALQRVVSHWGIASCVRDKDDGGDADWQNGKCKHRGPRDVLSFDICRFSPSCGFVFAGGGEGGDSFRGFPWILSSCHPLIPSCKPLCSEKKPPQHSSV